MDETGAGQESRSSRASSLWTAPVNRLKRRPYITARRIRALEAGANPKSWEILVISRALQLNPLWVAYGEQPESINEAERPFYEARYLERCHQTKETAT